MYFFGFRCYIYFIILLNYYISITLRVIFPKKYVLLKKRTYFLAIRTPAYFSSLVNNCVQNGVPSVSK